MDPGEAVRLAVEALIGDDSLEFPEPPPIRPAPPTELEAMLGYWGRGRRSTPELAAALGDPYVSRRRRDVDPAGYRAYEARSRQIRRWRAGARPSRAELRHLQKVTAAEWRQSNAGAIHEYELERARWRRRKAKWLAANPQPSAAEALTEWLAAAEAVIDFSGRLSISSGEGHRANTSMVTRGGPGYPYLQRFVAAAIEQRWDRAADELAQAWNRDESRRRYHIPAAISWLDVDHLELT